MSFLGLGFSRFLLHSVLVLTSFSAIASEVDTELAAPAEGFPVVESGAMFDLGRTVLNSVLKDVTSGQESDVATTASDHLVVESDMPDAFAWLGEAGSQKLSAAVSCVMAQMNNLSTFFFGPSEAMLMQWNAEFKPVDAQLVAPNVESKKKSPLVPAKTTESSAAVSASTKEIKDPFVAERFLLDGFAWMRDPEMHKYVKDAVVKAWLSAPFDSEQEVMEDTEFQDVLRTKVATAFNDLGQWAQKNDHEDPFDWAKQAFFSKDTVEPDLRNQAAKMSDAFTRFFYDSVQAVSKDYQRFTTSEIAQSQQQDATKANLVGETIDSTALPGNGILPAGQLAAGSNPSIQNTAGASLQKAASDMAAPEATAITGTQIFSISAAVVVVGFTIGYVKAMLHKKDIQKQVAVLLKKAKYQPNIIISDLPVILKQCKSATLQSKVLAFVISKVERTPEIAQAFDLEV